MTAKTRIVQRDVVSRPSEVPLIVGYGGGLNSCAVVVGLQERGIRPDLVSFADTGDEKPETYDHMEMMDAWLDLVGFPALTYVRKAGRTGDKSLEEECLRRETLPSRAFGLSSCAHRWKIEPQEKYLNHWAPAKSCWAAGLKPIKILGIDAGEAHRTKLEEDAKLRYWYPLVEWGWSREDCIKAVEGARLPIPVKSACFYCPSSHKAEIVALAATHFDLFKRAVAMETRALQSTRHELKTVKGLGRRFAWGTLLTISDVEREALPETPVEECLVCHDESCELEATLK